MAARIFDSPFLPALAAVRALAPAPAPGHGGGTEAQALVTHILMRLDQLAIEHAADGGAVPAAQADELRAHIERAIELVCPLVTDQEADERRQQAERRVWVEECFRLACGHLSL